MRAAVLPRKQLEYILAKTGFIKDDACGGWVDVDDDCFDEFCLCLKEIVINNTEDVKYPLESDGAYWKKEWFIPNSFKEVS